MAENSLIGWTDHTFNFWWGCGKVSAECLYCYIAAIMKRAGKEPFNGPMRTKHWDAPFRWNRIASRHGCRFRIFTCSMSDFYHEHADQWREEAWQIIRQCTNLDWLILTKRPELIPARLPDDGGDGYDNVWFGVTVGCKKSLNRISLLRTVPARIRFISAEPLLERIGFRPYLDGIHWIITGCEKAGKSKRRPMDIDWVRDIHSQCQDAGIAHFFKQRYDGTKIVFDGMLDGKVCQNWPVSNGRARVIKPDRSAVHG